MKIKIDRRKCTCWSAACETCFSWHYLGDEVRPNYCLIDMEDDGKPERTFYIEDRDGVDKVLVVDEDNWAEVYDGWQMTMQEDLN